MTTALQPVPRSDELPWRGKELDVIKQLIAPGLSDLELLVFGKVCQTTRLSPFQRQIYAIKRGNKMTIQTSIDGYRVIAARTGQLAGIEDAEYDSEENREPRWAKVTVYRMVHGQRCAFTAKARWSEYKPDAGPMWTKMPYLMLAKCAEALALRKAFPAELSGVYTDAEMDQADAPELPTMEATVREPTPAEECAALGHELNLEPAAYKLIVRSYTYNGKVNWQSVKSALETKLAEASLPQQDQSA